MKQSKLLAIACLFLMAAMHASAGGTTSAVNVDMGCTTPNQVLFYDGVNLSCGTDPAVALIPTVPPIQAYEGTVQRLNPFPVFKSGTVASNAAVINLTTDGTSGGTALFPNGVIADSVNVAVNDGTTIYPSGWAFSNGNKTLTVTVNKSAPTGVIALLGINILAAPVSANGAVAKVTVWGY